MTASRIGICYCYAHDDEPLKEELDKQLSTLKRQGLIKAWHDRDIGVGEEWKRKIDTHLNNSSVILLLISASFMASDYCYSVEMKRAIERHDAGEARVIPIILRPVDWEDAPFNKLQILPTNGKPIISSSRVHQDEAFLEIVLGIKKAVKELILLSTNATPIPTSSDQRASLHIEKQPINVLLIFANPRDTEPLQLAREERAIRNAIISSRYRDQIKITMSRTRPENDREGNQKTTRKGTVCVPFSAPKLLSSTVLDILLLCSSYDAVLPRGFLSLPLLGIGIIYYLCLLIFFEVLQLVT